MRKWKGGGSIFDLKIPSPFQGPRYIPDLPIFPPRDGKNKYENIQKKKTVQVQGVRENFRQINAL